MAHNNISGLAQSAKWRMDMKLMALTSPEQYNISVLQSQ